MKTASARRSTRILEEDPSLRFSRDPQTKEFLLAGSGQQHIEVVVAKLHKRYHVDLTLKPPKVPYRETIRGKADAEGKHKKQTGGHGQFGVCRVRLEPAARGDGHRIRGRHLRRRDPQELDSVGRERHPRLGRARLPRRFPGRGFPGDSVRRQISRRGQLGHGVQDRGIAGVQGRHEAGPAGAARARDARRGLCAGPVFGRHHGRPELAPRAHQRQRGARVERGGQGAGARSPRC